MKKATCTAFVNILNTVHEEGITSRAVLMSDPSLYTAFWFALKDFCHFALLSKTSGKNDQGEILPGNSKKIDLLEARGEVTRDAIETDCVIKVMDKLDLVLQQPIEKQKNYCYAICNNMVNDCFRKLPPDEIQIVSLNSTIEGTGIDAADAYTYEDVLSDDTYSPELVCFAREAAKAFKEEQEVKQAKERAENRATILRELTLLSKYPSEAFCRLACAHLAMKPRKLADLILRKGCKTAYAEILLRVARQNDMNPAEMQKIIADHPLTAESIKADTNNAEQVSCQISRLVYRAGKHLKGSVYRN